MTKFSSQSSIETLIDGCRQQQRLAQQYMYKRLYGRMLGVAMRYSSRREEAEAVLNLAFLKVFQSIHAYEVKAPFEAWVYRIVVNTAIDEMRRGMKLRHIVYDQTVAEGSEGNSGLENLVVEDIIQCLHQLDATSRAVFSLYEMEGYKHAEIGEILDMTESTSKWYLAKAKRELRELVTKVQQVRGGKRPSPPLPAVALGIALAKPLL